MVRSNHVIAKSIQILLFKDKQWENVAIFILINAFIIDINTLNVLF